MTNEAAVKRLLETLQKQTQTSHNWEAVFRQVCLNMVATVMRCKYHIATITALTTEDGVQLLLTIYGDVADLDLSKPGRLAIWTYDPKTSQKAIRHMEEGTYAESTNPFKNGWKPYITIRYMLTTKSITINQLHLIMSAIMHGASVLVPVEVDTYPDTNGAVLGFRAWYGVSAEFIDRDRRNIPPMPTLTEHTVYARHTGADR